MFSLFIYFLPDYLTYFAKTKNSTYMYISFSLTLQSTYKKASNILQNVNTNITESVDTASVPFVPRKLGHFDKQVLFLH